jgi:hypothetical protein
MWATILKAVPWSTVFSLAIKAVLAALKYKGDNDQAKEDVIRLIETVDAQTPIRVHDSYHDQIRRVRAKKQEEQAKIDFHAEFYKDLQE